MKNKLPNFEKILTQTIRNINPEFNYGETDFDVFKTLDFCFDPSPKRGIIFNAVKEYGKQVRDYTLQIASENAIADFTVVNDKLLWERKDIEVYVINSSILSLKNSKELEI